MPILLFFVISLGVGDVASEGVAQPPAAYGMKQLIHYAPQKRDMVIITDSNGDVWIRPKYLVVD